MHKQHEIYIANVKPTLAYPTRNISHWPMLGQPGLALGAQGSVFGPHSLGWLFGVEYRLKAHDPRGSYDNVFYPILKTN